MWIDSHTNTCKLLGILLVRTKINNIIASLNYRVEEEWKMAVQWNHYLSYFFKSHTSQSCNSFVCNCLLVDQTSILSCPGLLKHHMGQPCSQGSLLPALRSKRESSLSRSIGRVGENRGNEVAHRQPCLYFVALTFM